MVENLNQKKMSCQITYKPSANKIITSKIIIRDIFKKMDQLYLVTETGLAISLEKLVAIVPLED